MPYSKSIARQDFEGSVGALFLIARKAKRKNTSNDISEHVYMSCIFLLSAYVEEYLKMTVENWAYMINTHAILKKHIPSNFRTFLTIKANESGYKTYLLNNSISVAIKNLNLDLINNYRYVTDTHQHEKMQRNSLDAYKYPSLDNIQKIFMILGVNGIFNILGNKGKRNFKDIITDLGDVRTALAHSGSITLTYTDVEKHLVNLQEFVKYVDRIMYSHIVSTTGPNTWKTS